MDGGDPLPEAAGYGEKPSRVVADAPAEASRGVRGQRRRQEEAPRFEVEGWVHGFPGPVRLLADPCVRILAVSRVPLARSYGRKRA